MLGECIDEEVGAGMSVKHVHLNSRFVLALSLFVCLVVAACSSAGVAPTQTTPTVEVPAFVGRLQPLLLAKMQQLRIPGAIIFVDDPGQGSWTTTLGTSDLATKAPHAGQQLYAHWQYYQDVDRHGHLATGR
jgi:hypothetical protein